VATCASSLSHTFSPVLPPAGGEGRAHTKIGSDGNSHDQQVVRLPGEGGQQQTLTAELHVDGQCAALGTVQVAELHKVRVGAGWAGLGWWDWGCRYEDPCPVRLPGCNNSFISSCLCVSRLCPAQLSPSLPWPPTPNPQIANQGDLMFDTPPSNGFLKTIFPCLRKGSGGHQGSMAWVKLVDDDGRVAGHAVLSARISMAILGGQVGRGEAAVLGGQGAVGCRLWFVAGVDWQLHAHGLLQHQRASASWRADCLPLSLKQHESFWSCWSPLLTPACPVPCLLHGGHAGLDGPAFPRLPPAHCRNNVV